MTGWAVRRPLGVVAVWIALAVAGSWQLWRLPRVPGSEGTTGRLAVEATWPGAAPETMEAEVTSRLESAARRIGGVRSVSSVSSVAPGGGGSEARIDVRLARGRSGALARLALAERVAAVRRGLPGEVRVRVSGAVSPRDGARRNPLLRLHLRGPFAPALLGRLVRDRIRPALLSVAGVSEVTTTGTGRAATVVTPNAVGLAGHGLTQADLAWSVTRFPNGRRPVGTTGLGRTPVLLEWRGPDPAALRAVPVTSGRGEARRGSVRLGRLASVRSGVDRPVTSLRVRGDPAVALVVSGTSGPMSGTVSRELRRRLESVRPELPAGTRLEVDFDRAREWRRASGAVLRRTAAAAAVIAAVLALALRSAGLVATVAGSTAIGLLGGVLALGWRGGGLDLYGLAGLAWAGGLVASGALVVAGLTDSLLRRGGNVRRSAATAAREAAPVLGGAAATTVAALAPLAALQPESVPWLPSFATAVGGAVVTGVLASLTFVPAAVVLGAGRRLPRLRTGAGGRGLAAGRCEARTRMMERLARRPWRVLAAGAIALASVLGFVTGRIHRWPVEAPWAADGDRVVVEVRLDRGDDPEGTARAARLLEHRLGPDSALEYRTRVQPSSIRLEVETPPGASGPSSGAQVMARMVAAGTELSGADVRVVGLGPGFRQSGATRSEHAVQVTGYHYPTVRSLAEEVARRLAADRRVTDANPLGAEPWRRRRLAEEVVLRGRPPGETAARVIWDRVARELGPRVRGVTSVGAGGEQLPVRVRSTPGGYAPSLTSLLGSRVSVGTGGKAPVRRLFAAESRRVPGRIVRVDRRYRLVVSWSYGGSRALAQRTLRRALSGLELPDGYEVRPVPGPEDWGLDERRIAGGAGLALVAVFLAAAALLESWRGAAVVLLPVPAALAGAGLALVLLDRPLTGVTIAGLALAAGVVVDGALLVAHRARRLVAVDGLPAGAAAIRAAAERMPVLAAATGVTAAGYLGFSLPAVADGLQVWPTMSVASIGALLAGALASVTLVPAAIALGFGSCPPRGPR